MSPKDEEGYDFLRGYCGDTGIDFYCVEHGSHQGDPFILLERYADPLNGSEMLEVMRAYREHRKEYHD